MTNSSLVGRLRILLKMSLFETSGFAIVSAKLFSRSETSCEAISSLPLSAGLINEENPHSVPYLVLIGLLAKWLQWLEVHTNIIETLPRTRSMLLRCMRIHHR